MKYKFRICWSIIFKFKISRYFIIWYVYELLINVVFRIILLLYDISDLVIFEDKIFG